MKRFMMIIGIIILGLVVALVVAGFVPQVIQC